MDIKEFEKKFRNALEYFHGHELDDEEMDTITAVVAENVDIDKVNRTWYATPNHIAKETGRQYLHERSKRHFRKEG